MMKKAVIIGAGPAGLTAAYELLKKNKNYQVTIIESDNQVRGISKTVKYKDYRMDIGGHRFFSKDEEVLKFWEEFMPTQGSLPYDYKETGRTTKKYVNGPNPDKNDKVMLIRNRISRIYYLNHFFDYPITLKWQTFKNMGLVRTVVSGFSYLNAKLFKRKEDCLENFYINRFGKKLYSMFFEIKPTAIPLALDTGLR